MMPSTIEEQLAEYRAKKAQEVTQNQESEDSRNKNATSITADPPQISVSSYFVVPEVCKRFLEYVQNNRFAQALSVIRNGSGVKALAIRIILWLLIWTFFIKVGFGAIFFCVSLLFFIYYNTRTGPKNGEERSAYSVFNPNCERLDGTFTAEEFEQQLRSGRLR